MHCPFRSVQPEFDYFKWLLFVQPHFTTISIREHLYPSIFRSAVCYHFNIIYDGMLANKFLDIDIFGLYIKIKRTLTPVNENKSHARVLIIRQSEITYFCLAFTVSKSLQ